jgi:predicted O-methyltransferase YrrM
MEFPIESLQKLIALNKDVTTGVYYSKHYPHRPHVYSWTGATCGVHRNYTDIPPVPFKVDSCGAGFMLISKKVLKGYTMDIQKNQGRPFTRILADDGKTGADSLGEDTSFCMRMRDLGYEIYADPTFQMGHKAQMMVTGTHWKQILEKMRANDKRADGPDGWTTDEELKFLAERAAISTDIAEIGCWKGRSTKVLLDNTKGKVYAIDHFKGTDKEKDVWSGILADGEDIYAEFRKNVGNPDNLEVLRMGSGDAAASIKDASLDMLFIDGDHTYSGVIQDIDNYLPKMRKGGTICGHDYNMGFPDVIRAVHDRFDRVSTVGTIWYKEI